MFVSDDFICHCENKLIKKDQVCDDTKDCDCDWTELGEDENYYACPDKLQGTNRKCCCIKLLPNNLI